jgi:hypothetical protein
LISENPKTSPPQFSLFLPKNPKVIFPDKFEEKVGFGISPPVILDVKV